MPYLARSVATISHRVCLSQVMLSIVRNTHIELNIRERASNFFYTTALHKHKVHRA